MIGAPLVALFGDERGREVLYRIFPQTKQLSEEDQYGFELVKGASIEYLQWEVSKLEAARDSLNPTLGRRILKALGGL